MSFWRGELIKVAAQVRMFLSLNSIHDVGETTTPVDADEFVLADSANSYVPKKVTWANIKATLNAVYDWATVTHAATGKATPVDTDELSIVDSAASNVIKKLTWANLKATLKTYLDTLYVALTGSQTVAGVKTFSSIPILSGGAISFPATQVSSAGANDLDDYEEGTFTAGFAFGGATTGITYSAQSGTYTKVGRLVAVQGRITLSSKGSSVGAATITGLPFSPSVLAAGSVALFVSFSGLVDGIFLLAQGTTFAMRTGGAVSSAVMTDTNFTATSDIIFSAVYPV